jgi:predicted secreted protein
MAVFNATLTKIKIGGTAIAEQLDATLSITVNNFDVTSKDSGGWKKILPGLREWEISGDAIVDYEATVGWDSLFTSVGNRTELAIDFTTGITGDTHFTGNIYIESLEQGDPMEDKASYSFTLTGNGVLTAATI